MQESFKQYVKLSRLKIYVPRVHERKGCIFASLALSNNEGDDFVKAHRHATQYMRGAGLQYRLAKASLING